MSNVNKEESIFNEAIKIESASERIAYLKSACKEDAEFLARVEALLKVYYEDKSFLKASALCSDVTLDDSPVTEGPGTIIGRYKLLEKIGEGGMAVVYMAEQKKPIRRRVALKIIKLGMDTKQVIARFEAERQALAIMDHPNIAKVFDAGATETGRPYFVMELVRGISITEYCDKNGLSTKERLELFISVCSAVQHAHQKGIIHRDIKPSNVMVTLHDGEPLAKVIDFGIAKATNQQLTEKTLFTRYAQMIGTPAYMSPEQAEMSTLDVDTRTDIYSLGVLLYEILTGATPFDAEKLREAGYGEIQRIICEEEPPRPSTKLSTLGDDLTDIARHRQSSPDLLTKLMRGDLDWIVMKSLEKNRNRRYDTANELARDIQRHLADEPVVAGPPSTVYRLSKFIRRNRALVTAVSAVAVAIIVGLVISTAMYFQAEQARDKEAIARSVAEKARGIAEEAQTAEAQQRQVAENRAEDYRRSLYFNQIALADVAYRDGNTHRLRDLLESCPEGLRGWEWYRLNHISDQAFLTLRGHSGQVFGVAFSPDGKRIVSCGEDKTIKVWDAATGAEIRTFRGHEGPAWAVEFSPDGRWIVSAGSDKTIKVWDLANGKELITLRGHKSSIYSIAISPDGKRIVSGGDDKALKVWDSASGDELMILRGHTDRVFSVVFSPDGTRIISGSKDSTIKVWDAATGNELMTLRGHSDMVWSVAFSPDGKRVFSSSKDDTTKLWNLETGKEIKTFHSHASDIFSLSPDGKRIVSPGAYGIIYVWDATSGADLMTLRGGHESLIYSLAFGPDGERVVSSSRDGTIKVWNINLEVEYLTLHRHKDWVKSVVFSPDGKYIVSGSNDKTIKVWNVATGTEVMTLRGHAGKIHSVSVNPDGKHIASSSEDKTVKVWDLATGAELITLVGHENEVWSVAFSPDGKRIISGSEDKTIKVWDAATGNEMMTLRGHEGRVSSVSFSPDGKRIVSSSKDGTAKVWDVETGAELMTPYDHDGWVLSAAFSPDGKRIVTSDWDGTIRMWNAATGAEVIALPGHYGSPTDVAFAPDGRRMVSGSGDRKVKVWDVATGTELMTTRGYAGWIWSVAFSPDGKTIAIGGFNGITLLESEVPVDGYESRRTGAAARKVVDELYEKHGLYQKVIDELKADEMLDEAVREVTLQIANARLWEDAEKLKNQSQGSTEAEED